MNPTFTPRQVHKLRSNVAKQTEQVERMIANPLYQSKGATEIAAMVGCSPQLVRTLRIGYYRRNDNG